MVFFHSYVSLPEGNKYQTLLRYPTEGAAQDTCRRAAPWGRSPPPKKEPRTEDVRSAWLAVFLGKFELYVWLFAYDELWWCKYDICESCIYIWWIMMIYADMTYVKAPCEKLWKYLLSSAHISLDLDRDDWDRLRPSPSPTWLPRHGQAVDAFQSALQKTLGVGRIILFSWCNKSLSYLITILYITLHKYAILYSILASNYQWPVLDSQWLSAGFSMPACQTHAPCNLFNEWSSSSIPLATLLHASTILQSIAKLEQMIKPFLHFIWGIHLLLGGFLDFEVTVI